MGPVRKPGGLRNGSKPVESGGSGGGAQAGLGAVCRAFGAAARAWPLLCDCATGIRRLWGLGGPQRAALGSQPLAALAGPGSRPNLCRFRLPRAPAGAPAWRGGRTGCTGPGREPYLVAGRLWAVAWGCWSLPVGVSARVVQSPGLGFIRMRADVAVGSPKAPSRPMSCECLRAITSPDSTRSAPPSLLRSNSARHPTARHPRFAPSTTVDPPCQPRPPAPAARAPTSIMSCRKALRPGRSCWCPPTCSPRWAFKEGAIADSGEAPSSGGAPAPRASVAACGCRKAVQPAHAPSS